MSARTTRAWIPGLLLAIPFTAAPAAAELECELIPKFARAYLAHHVRHRNLSPEIQQRAVDHFLRRLDPSMTVLLESEAQALEASLHGVFEKIREGECGSLLKAHATMSERYVAVEKFVRQVLSAEDYEIDREVAWVLDAEDRGRPKTRAEWEDLLRRMIHFQMANYLLSDEKLEDAKPRLVHRYELRAERFADLTSEDVYARFLDAFASSLDPHSSYLSQEVLEDFRIGMSLSLEGIGVALSERDGYAVVERIIPGGAADKHGGLKPKDKFIAVAQEDGAAVDIVDMPLREAVSLIRGKKGTKVALTVLRQGEETNRFQVVIERDKIDLKEQAAKLTFEERVVGDRKMKLAVLELPSFYGDSDAKKRQCTDDVAELLAQVNEEGADGLVLDLSRNGGGLLEHAVKISGFFIRKGEIVGIRSARGDKHVLPDRDESVLYSGPMVVHTSRVSASASEILAGALKDYRRAVIVGDDHTFGKGTVQTVQTLPPGQGALKITTALFYRPGGRSTQNDGVDSDVVIPSSLLTDELGEKHQDNPLKGDQITPFLSSFANANSARTPWRPVTSDVVAALVERSRGRVSSSEDFAELREKLDEARENNGVVRLAELLEEREKAKEPAVAENTETVGGGALHGQTAAVAPPSVPAAESAAEGEDGEAEEEEPSPQLDEALNILADLVDLTTPKTPQTRAAERSEDDARPSPG